MDTPQGNIFNFKMDFLPRRQREVITFTHIFNENYLCTEIYSIMKYCLIVTYHFSASLIGLQNQTLVASSKLAPQGTRNVDAILM